LIQALKGREKPLSPFQGSHQFFQGSRGFTPGYYLSRFQRSGGGTHKSGGISSF
jgi:hypothetical protein